MVEEPKKSTGLPLDDINLRASPTAAAKTPRAGYTGRLPRAGPFRMLQQTREKNRARDNRPARGTKRYRQRFICGLPSSARGKGKRALIPQLPLKSPAARALSPALAPPAPPPPAKFRRWTAAPTSPRPLPTCATPRSPAPPQTLARDLPPPPAPPLLPLVSRAAFSWRPGRTPSTASRGRPPSGRRRRRRHKMGRRGNRLQSG